MQVACHAKRGLLGAVADLRETRPFRLHEQVVLFRIGQWTFVTFGLFAALGGFLATWMVFARQLQAELPIAELAWPLAVMVPFLALVGSRLYALVLLEWRDFLADPWQTLLRTTLGWQGGFVMVTAGVLLLAWSQKIDLMVWIDTFSFGVPLGQAFGRIGCHTYGCCHGRPTRVPWAIVVHNPLSKTVWHSGLGDVPLHPVQLYSAAGDFALTGVLAATALTGPLHAGSIAAIYLVLDGVMRFALELVRDGLPRRYAGVSPFQWFAVFQVGVGAAVAIRAGEQPLADFSTGLWPSLVDAMQWWPACAVAGLGMLFWTGIHRGDPGSLSVEGR
jgi:phosphatidylglycerol:prolipoprotein diacylglycerol transferase